MADQAEAAAQPKPTLNEPYKSLHKSNIDGTLFSFMVGVGETFFPAFVLALGLGEVISGLVAVIPVLVGALLQLISPRAVQELKSHKKWVVICAGIQALSFLPLILMALFEKKSSLLIFAAAVLYWTGGLSTTAAWNAWMGKLVPKEIRTKYFAKRNRLAHLGVLVGLIVGAQIASYGKAHDQLLLGFAVMFFLGLLARSASTYFLTQQMEPKGTLESQEIVSTFVILKQLASKKEGKILKYLLFAQVMVHISAPYFSPYMLKQLDMGYEFYMILVCSSYLARALVLPIVGKYANHFSATRLLKLGGLLIIPLPTLWIFSNDVIYLIGIQILSGACWALFELGTTLSFFEGIEEKRRTSVLTVFGFANALAMTVGSLIGGKIIYSLGTDIHAYFVIFVISAVGRTLALLFLRGMPDIRTGFRVVASKVLAVRPSFGAFDKPVLTTIEKKKSPKKN